ncbi:hypothetical protein OUZ56_020541 [Daphnia magna]|uniref:Uncharacterized protein n=1 Tax=Daphnia magna TaxID=35525 RepID=A0ABQ9ZG89_9CRUS|nr:hypothetical protein OUZ56_020541 [Daphnia magna]
MGTVVFRLRRRVSSSGASWLLQGFESWSFQGLPALLCRVQFVMLFQPGNYVNIFCLGPDRHASLLVRWEDRCLIYERDILNGHVGSNCVYLVCGLCRIRGNSLTSLSSCFFF